MQWATKGWGNCRLPSWLFHKHHRWWQQVLGEAAFRQEALAYLAEEAEYWLVVPCCNYQGMEIIVSS